MSTNLVNATRAAVASLCPRRAVADDADRIAAELRREWAPVFREEEWKWRPDPTRREAILKQILAMPRPVRRRLPVRAVAVLVVVALAAVVLLSGCDDPATRRPAGGGEPSAVVDTRPACQAPPAGVQSPADVRVYVPGQPVIPVTLVYGYRDLEGLHVWQAYGPGGQAIPRGARLRTGLIPGRTTVDLVINRVPGGGFRFRAPPCIPSAGLVPEPATPHADSEVKG